MDHRCPWCGGFMDGDRWRCDCLVKAQEQVLSFKVFWTVIMIASAVVVVYKALTGG